MDELDDADWEDTDVEDGKEEDGTERETESEAPTEEMASAAIDDEGEDKKEAGDKKGLLEKILDASTDCCT